MNLKNLPTSAILSEEVESAQGQRIGYIKDLTVSLDTGTIAYAVLAVGGLFGIGTKLYAVPWTQLTRRGHVFALTVDWRTLPSLELDGLDNEVNETNEGGDWTPTAVPTSSAERPEQRSN